MNLQTHIRQQQSTVQMLEKLLRAKRCSQDEVDQAKRRLVDLQEQESFKPLIPPVPQRERVGPPLAPVPTGRVLDGDEYLSIQADLSKQADQLNRKMAELSNTLHTVPTNVSCPELVKPILELKAQIEAIWDKKRYLERNRFLPETSAGDAPERPELLADTSRPGEARFELAYQKRRLVDMRSKLRRKLADPKAKLGKKHEWETELMQVELKMLEIDVKLC
jgi:hypothetical protein